MDIKIKPIRDSKSAKLKTNELIKNHIIPEHGYSCAFIGATGSGKSVLLSNMLMRFYADIYKPEDVYLFSPTAKMDDIANQMNLRDSNRVDDNLLEKLQVLLKNRKQEVEDAPTGKTPPMLIILDDFTGNRKLNNSVELIRLFTASRHLNTSLWVCVHKYKGLQRTARMNCMSMFIFATNKSEIKAIYDEQGPPHQSYAEFEKMFKFATDEPYSFLSIFCKQPYATRFRKNLDTILQLKIN